MKRIFCLISVFLLVLAVVSCSRKGSENSEIEPGSGGSDNEKKVEEQVSQEISAEEGGTVKTEDEKISIEIPANALDSDVTITMTVYDSVYYVANGKRLISKVVEFEPSGTIFKKPVLISMISNENIENKVITAAVFNTEKGDWSYSETGAAVQITGRDEAGDPIMTTAAGDPIMLNAGGDPIMIPEGGGDPIMLSAAGDPIMNSAAGDPIMMTTGHFTAYTFIALEPEEEEKPDSGEVPESDGDAEYANDDDEETLIVFDYSHVPCTGQRTCGNGTDKIIECPREGDDFYGQDAQYVIRKSCVPQSFKKIVKADDETSYSQTVADFTGITWLFTGKQGVFDDEMSTWCDELSFDGHDDWRLPTPKEFLTIADHDLRYSGYAVREAYFPDLDGSDEGRAEFWSSLEGYYYSIDGSLKKSESLDVTKGYMCVRGEEYGKIDTENYVSLELDYEEPVDFDKQTQLVWGPDKNNIKSLKEALDFCENLDYAGYYDWRVPNKNELATLLAYPTSSASDVFSLMPGISSAVYITSTSSYRNIGENSADIQPWVVNMRDGTVKIAEINSGTSSDFTVRCVRSKIIGAKKNIPECHGNYGYTPCNLNSHVWSSRVMFADDPSVKISWENIAQKCLDLNFNGSDKWRIPELYELEMLVNEGHSGESVLYDYGNLVSGEAVSQDGEKVKSINTVTGEVSEFSSDYASNIVVRCVYDETLPDPKEFPYIDYENNLVWSKVSDKELNWHEAAEYCETLDEGGSTNWKVPTLEELKKLQTAGSCFGDEISCYPGTKGEHSVFGDIYSLWSSSFKKKEAEGEESEEEPVENYFVVVDFLRAYYKLVDEEHSASRVRCVHKLEEETIKFPYHTNYTYDDEYYEMLWSYKSDFVASIDEAQAFCQSLNDSNYGDEVYDEGDLWTEDYYWSLPSLSYILSLIKSDVCSNKAELRESVSESWRCSEYSLNGYSEVGDIDSLITYSNKLVGDEYVKHYYLFDFLSGELIPVSDSEVAGYVRCYANPPE